MLTLPKNMPIPIAAVISGVVSICEAIPKDIASNPNVAYLFSY